MNENNQNLENEQQADVWISISDLMSGLMLLFLLIAITFMFQVNKNKNKIDNISEKFANIEKNLNKALLEEFTPEELEKWNVDILDDNTVRFNSPDVLFHKGDSEVKPLFKGILEDFFPRYIGVLKQPTFSNFVEEVRIEGHTSSGWNSRTSEIQAYTKNLELSQERAKNVLKFAINIKEVENDFKWLKKRFRANGLSSAIPITDQNDFEDKEKSRRVEFRITTNARKALRDLEELRLKMSEKESK
jgi:outer membrane protein OmpA-like peptidoglycan-associated protein